MIIGKIYGETRPDRVQIAIQKNINVKYGEYVKMRFPEIDDWVIGNISEIKLINELYPDELLTSNMLNWNLEEGEKMSADVNILGYPVFRDSSVEFIKPRVPPKPGENVYLADNEILSKMFRVKNGICVGSLMNRDDVEVYLNADEVVRRHLAVLASTGSGKSHTVGVIVEELLKKSGSIVIFDVHSEYIKLKSSKNYSKMVKIFEPSKNLFFRLSSLNYYDLVTLLNIQKTASNQRSLLYLALKELKERYAMAIYRNWYFDELKEVILKVAEREDLKKQVSSVMRKIDRVENYGIFKKDLEVSIKDIAMVGRASVVSLSGFPIEIQQVIVSIILTKILRARTNFRLKKNGEKLEWPVFLVIEEAHNFIPAYSTNISKEIIRKIASEGRKFGVGICIVSQSPRKIDSDVLSQCNSMIIMRTINPSDQAQIKNSSESMSERLLSDLPGLNKGEAVIVGPAISIPALVKIRERETEHGGADIPIVESWEEWKERLDEKYVE